MTKKTLCCQETQEARERIMTQNDAGWESNHGARTQNIQVSDPGVNMPGGGTHERQDDETPSA